MNEKSAIILGATGLTGGILLEKLLKNPAYGRVKIFSRRTTGVKHPKLQEYIQDLFHLDNLKDKFFADEVYCCVGSTQAKTPDREIYREVDYGIPVLAARLAKENGIKRMLVVSALGAHPESRFFYNRIKGEMERDILELGLPETYFFQPSLINGKRQEKRPFEYLWKKLMRVGNFLLLGPLKVYRSIAPEVIVKAMLVVASEGYYRPRIPSDEIKKIAKKPVENEGN